MKALLIKTILLAAITTALLITPETSSAADKLTLGVHPYLAASDLTKRFSPLATYLQRQTGIPVEVDISSDYEEHINNIAAGKFDLAYLGPASYVSLVKQHGAFPLLGVMQVKGLTTFQGVIIVRNESPLMSLADLKGKKFAFGDPNSTMSHLVPRFMLYKAGIPLKALRKHSHLKNHENVALGVLTGNFDAGAVKMETYQKYSKKGLRALKMSPKISEHIFVARHGLSDELTQKLRDAMTALTPEHRDSEKILGSIKKKATALEPAKDSDYNNLREVLQTLKDIGVMP